MQLDHSLSQFRYRVAVASVAMMRLPDACMHAAAADERVQLGSYHS